MKPADTRTARIASPEARTQPRRRPARWRGLTRTPAPHPSGDSAPSRWLQIAVVLIAFAALSGCATLFNDKTPSVDVASNPEGASVYVNGNYVGETPVSVDLSVRKEHAITFRKDGYRDKTYQVSRSVGIGWVILDILGGLVPLIVDAATGDWFMLDDDSVNVIMSPTS